MIEQMTTDLINLLIAYGIFGCAFGANIVLSLRLNLAFFNQKFDYKKLLSSVLHALSIVVGSALMVVSINLITQFIGIYGTDIGNTLTSSAIILVIGKATLRYLMEAKATFDEIFNVQNEAKNGVVATIPMVLGSTNTNTNNKLEATEIK